MPDGTWSADRHRDAARLTVRHLPVAGHETLAIGAQAERLLRFIDCDATSFDVCLVPVGARSSPS